MKFRQIDKATLARLQTRDEADKIPNVELEEEESDDDSGEGQGTITTTMTQRNNEYHHGERTTFIVDPNMDLNSPALLDMISPDPIVTEKITATEQKSVNELERKISVAEAFESHPW